ncbi:endonuclease domain-containing protein [Bacteroides sp. 519]|uniref:endonuclease domain-containing protein n=1 Tax=Bacteroides sp. 519 TaxID=2302937 RepID=UPI0013D1D5BD|nr:endonuclease domain-containing protein [Bacteroides sp. 519]NDV58971.1 endonuclease domain-containing protein [Bacteroides sp. 519]
MGEFINRDEQQHFRKKLRKNLTPAEAALWQIIKGKQVEGLKFRRQQGIGPYILDFYCPELLLGIELDGEQHYYNSEYDDNRTNYLFQKAGIKIIRFENKTVFLDAESIVREILEHRDKIVNKGDPDRNR